jgi:integrase
MPKLTKRLTDRLARTVALPAKDYEIYWCPKTPGLGVRVSYNGDRAYVAERRVDGKTVRRTLGKAAGPAAISADIARQLQITVSSELRIGVDRLELKRERREEEKADALTFAAALESYVKNKRRSKDQLPLKQRTIDDYLAMLRPAGATKRGKPTHAGELHAIADKPLVRISADDIRRLHASLEPRGQRRQTYAMQVLRAVLRHHGVNVVDNPLSADTAGAKRVALASTRGNPLPIPPERLGAWWRAACAEPGASSDQVRFMLLTGCRPGEAAGLLVGDVNMEGGRALLRDTKNRKDHVLVLSRQAAELVARNCLGKRAGDLVFGVENTAGTVAAINAVAGTPEVTPHKMRHSFASIADDLVSAATARAMLNHSGGDVTQIHYIKIGEAKLRKAWQSVADSIEAQAAT